MSKTPEPPVSGKKSPITGLGQVTMIPPAPALGKSPALPVTGKGPNPRK